jgi:hypothetical protein
VIWIRCEEIRKQKRGVDPLADPLGGAVERIMILPGS